MNGIFAAAVAAVTADNYDHTIGMLELYAFYHCNDAKSEFIIMLNY